MLMYVVIMPVAVLNSFLATCTPLRMLLFFDMLVMIVMIQYEKRIL